MKNPASDTGIKNIIQKIDDLILYTADFIKSGKAHVSIFLNESNDLSSRFADITNAIEQVNLLGYFSERQFQQIESLFHINDDAIESALLEISTGFLDRVGDVVEGVFPQTQENIFVGRLRLLKSELKKCISRAERSKSIIIRLKQPILWENITLILKGTEIEIKQDKTSLGDYHLYALGFPKVRNRVNTRRNVLGLFISLFCTDKSELLDSTNNNNQKLKSSLSKILCGAFNTHKDPIVIELGLYKARFITRFGGDLRVNDYLSGKSITEQDEYQHQKMTL
jgi:hypothetical protein